MKKTLLTILCAFISLFGMAQNTKTYTDQLTVTINGESSEPQQTVVDVIDNGNGTINFLLKNFILQAGEQQMFVGNISIENLVLTDGEAGLKQFTYDSALIIQPGNMEGVAETDWIGPYLGEIPLKLQGKMNDEKLFVTIDIDMQAVLGQNIYVQFGTDDFTTKPKRIYTDQLIITINGESSEPQTTDVTVIDNGDGTINFEMPNFFMVAGENSVPVGNIYIENLLVTEGEDGLKHVTFEAPMTIKPGNLEGYSEADWVGPYFGSIPLKLRGKMNDEKFYAVIDIDITETFGQVLFVQFGTDDFATKIQGDLNADGKVDIADAVTVLNIMAAGDYDKDADVNSDEKVDIADFVTVLNMMAAQ